MTRNRNFPGKSFIRSILDRNWSPFVLTALLKSLTSNSLFLYLHLKSLKIQVQYFLQLKKLDVPIKYRNTIIKYFCQFSLNIPLS
uniref:Putative ovule protein n=1 Tax=Solanum chacoense TaxID=4108 RepID=A0A0V0GMT8_SOLCH